MSSSTSDSCERHARAARRGRALTAAAVAFTALGLGLGASLMAALSQAKQGATMTAEASDPKKLG